MVQDHPEGGYVAVMMKIIPLTNHSLEGHWMGFVSYVELNVTIIPKMRETVVNE